MDCELKVVLSGRVIRLHRHLSPIFGTPRPPQADTLSFRARLLALRGGRTLLHCAPSVFTAAVHDLINRTTAGNGQLDGLARQRRRYQFYDTYAHTEINHRTAELLHACGAAVRKECTIPGVVRGESGTPVSGRMDLVATFSEVKETGKVAWLLDFTRTAGDTANARKAKKNKYVETLDYGDARAVFRPVVLEATGFTSPATSTHSYARPAPTPGPRVARSSARPPLMISMRSSCARAYAACQRRHSHPRPRGATRDR